MGEYRPPLRDMQFVLRHLVDMEALSALPGREDFNLDLALAVLEEAGRFAATVLSPLNRKGDVEGARWSPSGVATPPGWQRAYAQFVEAGWNGLSGPVEFAGQGCPQLLSALTGEMWNGANMAFALCPLLTHGAIQAIELSGSEVLKQTFLPRMVAGRWTGAMDLTESQAGSDLAAVRARAVPQADGSYRLHGQKIFITYGEHDLTENIVHLVLARTPDAPEGVKGISLFAAPKHLVAADGSLGARNDVVCSSIEHKMGIHGSPTCTMDFGARDGAVAYRVGEENRGVEYMFVMMNAARFGVGLQGLGISQRAYQRALDYAGERIQGVAAGRHGPGKVAIREHPDVRRMLLLMRSQTEAMRALAAVVACAMDMAHAHPDPMLRQQKQGFVDLMIPVVKGWMTETAVEIASLGVQIHGGMGYIEETGAAQHLRDVRIATIYEGTTGIQAADLAGRKIARDQGAAAHALIDDMHSTVTRIGKLPDEACRVIGKHLGVAVCSLRDAVAFVVAHYHTAPEVVLAGSVPLLKLFGIVTGGWQMARAANAVIENPAAAPDAAFCEDKLAVARFYAEHILTQAPALLASILASPSTLARSIMRRSI